MQSVQMLINLQVGCLRYRLDFMASKCVCAQLMSSLLAPLCTLQSVQMFIDHQVGYLDIMKLNEACCEAHQKELVALPNLEEIVHYDQWARRWVKEAVEGGKFKPRVAVQAATAAA